MDTGTDTTTLNDSCPSLVSDASDEDSSFPLIEPVPVSLPKNSKYPSGYDCEFVDPPPSLIQSECTICLLIFRKPYLVSCCGHNYCNGCITRMIDSQLPCPLCQSVGFTILHNQSLERCLAQMNVRCSHHKLGCQWTGAFAKYDGHLNLDPDEGKQIDGCKYAELQCSYECGAWFYRGAIQRHQNECPQRPLCCVYCHEYSSHHDDVVNRHWSVCKRYPVPCPNQCMANSIERENLDEHLEHQCPLKLIECEFRSAGCEVIVFREEMSDHLEKWHVQHTSMLAAANRKLVNGFGGKVERRPSEQKESDSDWEKEKDEAQRQMDNLWVENALLKQKVTQMQVDMDELRDEMCSFTNLYNTGKADRKEDQKTCLKLEREMSELRSCLELSQAASSQQCNYIQASVGVFPVEFVMTEFSRRMEMKEEWRSVAFYSHLQGYRFCLMIYPSEARDSHLAVHVALMCGDHDDKLQWPFHGEITVQLRNLLADRHHATGVIKFTEMTPSEFSSRVKQPKEGEEESLREGWGLRRFILHSELRYNSVKNRQYLKDDKLCFRVINVRV